MAWLLLVVTITNIFRTRRPQIVCAAATIPVLYLDPPAWLAVIGAACFAYGLAQSDKLHDRNVIVGMAAGLGVASLFMQGLVWWWFAPVAALCVAIVWYIGEPAPAEYGRHQITVAVRSWAGGQFDRQWDRKGNERPMSDVIPERIVSMPGGFEVRMDTYPAAAGPFVQKFCDELNPQWFVEMSRSLRGDPLLIIRTPTEAEAAEMEARLASGGRIGALEDVPETAAAAGVGVGQPIADADVDVVHLDWDGQ